MVKVKKYSENDLKAAAGRILRGRVNNTEDLIGTQDSARSTRKVRLSISPPAKEVLIL
jgi:hypothetical protein